MSITGERGFNQATKAVALLDAPLIAQADLTNSAHWINDKSISGKRQGATVYVSLTGGGVTTAVAQGAEPTDGWSFFNPASLPVAAVRKKNEVRYTGLSLAIPTTETNLISLLKTQTPVSGVLNQFFNTASNKINVYNDDSSMVFKINISGSWTTATDNRTMRLNFLGTNGNTLFQSRYANNVTPDVVNFQIFFSVDKNGNMALNGTAPVIQSYGSVFTATDILLIAEQVTAVSSITPV